MKPSFNEVFCMGAGAWAWQVSITTKVEYLTIKSRILQCQRCLGVSEVIQIKGVQRTEFTLDSLSNMRLLHCILSWIVSLQNSRPPKTSEYDFIWIRAFADVITKVIKMGPKSSVLCPYMKIMWRHRDTYREEGHVKIEAKIGMMQLQARECWQPPKAWKRPKSYLLEPSEGARPWWHLDFERLASRTMRE